MAGVRDMTEGVSIALERGNEPGPTAPGARGAASGARQIVSAALAGVLLVAAGLKAESVLGSRIAAEIDRAGMLSLAAAGAECVIAAWLLSGWAPVAARRVAMGLLVVFAGVAGWRLVSGAADCGCFGRLHVHPAWTFSFDLLALVGLWLVGRGPRPIGGVAGPLSGGSPVRCVFAVLVAAVVPTATVFAAGRLLEPRGGAGGAALVVLEPETWPGKPLPMLEYVADRTARAELASGRYTVVLFNRDCHVCQEHLARLAAGRPVAATAGGLGEATSTLRLMDVAPPDTPRDAIVPPALKQVPLRQDVQYIVEVPVEVTIADGIVQSVRRN
jgi:hypothetical protein